MIALTLQSLAQLSAERILNCTVEGTIVALLAWLLLRVLGPQNSGTRFAVWFAALFGIAALPLLGNWAASGAEVAKPSEITMPGSWALYIFAVWLLIADAGLLRVAIGFWHLHRLRKSCVPVDVATLDPLLQKTLAEFDSPRAVKLSVSEKLRVPTAIGFVKPVVAIPSWTMRELSAAELNPILLHELAHLKRRDDWSNLVQKILGALLFFHPAVWWIEKKLALEREMACDDMVLAQTEATNPRAYAECLVSLAEKSVLRRGIALAQAAVERMKQVSLRVSQILDVNRPRATRVWTPAPVVVTGVSLLCLLALSHAPTRLVSFESGAASSGVTNSIAAEDFAAKEMSHMSPLVVPAKLQFGTERTESDVRRPVSMVAKSAGKRSFKQTPQPDVIPASAVQRRVKAPMLVRTSMTTGGIAPQTVLFITQTEVVQDGNLRTEFVQNRQYDASGAVVWDLCVWRVTMVAPEQNPQNKMAGIAAKSI
jgi:beta-lactamase regulating signal transducer with metallopeptidase domain